MQKNHGFSLIEVLISLFLVTSITLLLLKEQWQCNQFLRQSIQQLKTCTELDNDLELKISGYSLIELLIAIFLSSILIMGLTKHFIQIKSQQKISDEYFKKETEIQWIADLIKMSVQNSGYTPCLPLNQLITFDGRDKSENISGLVVTENSVKTMRMKNDFKTLNSLDDKSLFEVPNSFSLGPNKYLLISDCYHAEIQKPIFLYRNKIVKLSNPLKYNYSPPIYIGELKEEIFFIKKSKATDPSIYYKSINTEELSSLLNVLKFKLEKHLGHSLVVFNIDSDNRHLLKSYIKSQRNFFALARM